MNINQLTDAQREVRQNVRNHLLNSEDVDLYKEKRIYLEKGDQFRADCVEEVLEETRALLDELGVDYTNPE